MRLISSLVLIAIGALLGCGEPAPPPPPAAAPTTPPPVAKLTLLVAGDDPLAEGVRLLRGEWKARSGGDLDVAVIPLDQLAGNRPAADLIIFPSRYLGALVEQDALRPVRESVLSDPQLALADIFPAIRFGEMRYGGQTWALPLGSPPLLAAYREDLIQSQGGRPPSTWTEYRRVIELAPKAPIEESAPAAIQVALPLGGRDAAYPLLARALCYTESHLRGEALFDPADMRPRITDPPFVRALDEIAAELATRNELDIKQPPATFADALRKVRGMQAGLAFGWPGLEADTAEVAAPASVVMAPLPIAERVYSPSQRNWTNQVTREPVTLLGAEGRLVAVTAASRNAVSAFQLARWLTTGSVAEGLSSRSEQALWFRRSQVSRRLKWTGDHGQGDDDGAAAATEALQTETPWIVPRIPAIDEYLEALAEAVRTAGPGDEAAQIALTATAEKWESITNRLGREAQALAYRRHLGIDSLQQK